MNNKLKSHFGTWSTMFENEGYPKLLNAIKDSFKNVKRDYKNTNLKIYPEVKDIFRAFREVEMDRCENVLIGLDPYPGEYNGKPSACGLSFITENGYINPSLKILLEVLQLESPDDFKKLVLKKHPTLMLNVALTIIAGKTGSHLKYWKETSYRLINAISKERPDLNWILLGNEAKALEKYIFKGNILKAKHPMGYRYAGDKSYTSLKEVFTKLNWIT